MDLCFQIGSQLCHLEVKEIWEDKTQTIRSRNLQEKASQQVSVHHGAGDQSVLQSPERHRVYSCKLLQPVSFMLLD